MDKTDSDWTPYIRTGIIALTDRIIIIIKTTQASEFIVDNIQLEKLSTATDYVEYIKGGCCPDNLCWDGTNCVGQQEFSEYIDPATTPATGSTAYMCINGDWQSTTLKWNKGNTNWAYCPGNMCYNGAANNNIADCVDEGIYDTDLISKIQKDVCRAGGWTTEDLLDYDDELYSCSASSYADTQLGTCELPYNLITTQGLTSYTLSVESGTTYDIKALKTGADATISLTDATPASLTIDSDFYTGSFTANSNTVTLSITSGTIDDIFVMKHSLTPVYHCSVDSTWDGNSYVANDGSATSSGTIDKLKDTVQTTPSGITPASSGCCPASSCWDGTNCIESRDLILTQDYLCVDGGWIDSVEKWNPIHTSSSLYCLETECYDGTSCVEANTQSSGTDDYCEGIEDSGGIVIDTSWTSRTKRIAIQLLEFAQTKSEYALYCDEKSNALNSLEIVSGTDVTDVNNFCVLNYGDKVALGTTLNTGENLISNLADIDCSGVTADDGKFYQCDSNKAWFNPSLGGLIYQKDGITLTSTTLIGDWWTAFTGFLRGLFGGVPSTDNIAFVNKQPFDKLYIYNDDGESKKVNGVLGKEEANDFIFVEYTGFSSDLCAIINQHEDLAGYCTPSTGAAGTIFTVYVPNAQQKHKAMWQDLTSKLRIKK